jgi:hypothetical protein
MLFSDYIFFYKRKRRNAIFFSMLDIFQMFYWWLFHCLGFDLIFSLLIKSRRALVFCNLRRLHVLCWRVYLCHFLVKKKNPIAFVHLQATITALILLIIEPIKLLIVLCGVLFHTWSMTYLSWATLPWTLTHFNPVLMFNLSHKFSIIKVLKQGLTVKSLIQPYESSYTEK